MLELRAIDKLKLHAIDSSYSCMSLDLLPSPVNAACHPNMAVYVLTSVFTCPNILSTPSGGTWRDRVLLDKLSVRMVFLSPSLPLVPSSA